MKKTLIALAALCTLIAAIANSVSAQGTNNVIAFTDTKAFTKSLGSLVVLDDSVVATNLAELNTINTKAIKDFNSRFGTAVNERWYTSADGFFSYFTTDGNTNRVYYDKKGHWQGTLKFYSENKLPRDIRAAVKSTYYDYTITIVEEVQARDNMVYIIHLEDAKSIKNLKVSKDGEIEVMEEFTKG